MAFTHFCCGERRGQFTRLLRNPSVTVAEMAAAAAERTAMRVVGRDVIAIQDTTELVLGGRQARANGYGSVGKGGALGGLLLHPILAVDAASGALLGLVDIRIWYRAGAPAGPRRARARVAKESQRWLAHICRLGHSSSRRLDRLLWKTRAARHAKRSRDFHRIKYGVTLSLQNV